MNALRMFAKPTIITVQTGAGKHISARSLFSHLRDALSGCELCDVASITVHGDGAVSLDGQTVYQPRRLPNTANRKARDSEGA